MAENVILMDAQKLRSFQSTSTWHTYKIGESTSEEEIITPLFIYRNLKVFNELYTVTSIYGALEDLLCFELSLEERPHEPKKKKRKSKTKEKEKDKEKEKEIKLKSYIIKVAVSPEDSVMFCNRSLNAKFKELFAELFKANEIVLYDLSGSPPYELLLFYRQAITHSEDANLQVKLKTMDSKLERIEVTENSVLTELGCYSWRLPQIRKLSCHINNKTLHSSDPSIKDISLGEVELELQGPHILDFYLKLGERNYVSHAPDWVVACKNNGKTHRRVRYS